MTRTLAVIGHGMAGHRLAEEVRSRAAGGWHIVILGEEPRHAYDRVALSSCMEGKSPEDLDLTDHGFRTDPRIDIRLSTTAVRLDRTARRITCSDGTRVAYDALVLATGSRPFVPPVTGHDLPGCFVYRTVEDVEAIRSAAVAGQPAVVIGGGLLGLEAANALRLLGMRPHVVEMAPRLMAQQIDDGGGRVLAELIGQLGVRVHCSAMLASIDAGPDQHVRSVTLADGEVIETRLVVFSAGIRPRDELAEPAGLARGERGGFLVDALCRTTDEHIWAIGECAAVEGRCYGLAPPGFRMAETVAGQLLDSPATPFAGADTSAKLKLMGVDVAGFGDAFARETGAVEFIRDERDAGRYAKLVLASDGRTLLGGVLAGDAHAYPVLRSLIGRELHASPDQLLNTPSR